MDDSKNSRNRAVVTEGTETGFVTQSLLPQNRMWRKNRSASRSSSCLGVDLNRNFDANWCSKCPSHIPVQP